MVEQETTEKTEALYGRLLRSLLFQLFWYPP
jgi:hypothetical protein